LARDRQRRRHEARQSEDKGAGRSEGVRGSETSIISQATGAMMARVPRRPVWLSGAAGRDWADWADLLGGTPTRAGGRLCIAY